MEEFCSPEGDVKQKGFTLVELMIVVAIVGVLAAVAIPAFSHMLKVSYKEKHGRWPEDWSDQQEWEYKHGTTNRQNSHDDDQTSRVYSGNVTYYKDNKTGLCFAQIGNSITTVPCDKIRF